MINQTQNRTKRSSLKQLKLNFALVLFFAISVILYLSPVLLVFYSLKAGFFLIKNDSNKLLFFPGLLLVAFGVFISIYLIQLLFKKNSSPSHLMELTNKQEPQIFELTQVLSKKLGTSAPTKICLSADSTPLIFFNANFFNCLFLAPKRLSIGLAQVNSATSNELNALIIRELAYFCAQNPYRRYVYWYQILHQQLFADENILEYSDDWIKRLSFLSFMTPAVIVAEWLYLAIRWIQKQLFQIITFYYQPIGHLIEFHVDKATAEQVGTDTLKNILLRESLIKLSFQTVLKLYTDQALSGLKPLNLYPLQQITLRKLAQNNNLEIKNRFPQVDLVDQPRFISSRLITKQQWRWHLELEDRISALPQNQVITEEDGLLLASEVFLTLPAWQTQMTQQLVTQANYFADKEEYSSELIETDIIEQLQVFFDDFFNNYYDQHNPTLIPVELAIQKEQNNFNLNSGAELFHRTRIQCIFEQLNIKNDLAQLQQIIDEEMAFQTLDYAGQKYDRTSVNALLLKLNQKLELCVEGIQQLDQTIFSYFFKTSKLLVKSQQFLGHYQCYFKCYHMLEAKKQLCQELIEHTRFIFQKLPPSTILFRIAQLLPLEERFKKLLIELLADPDWFTVLSPQSIEILRTYAAQTWNYFEETAYNDQAVEALLYSVYVYEGFLEFAPFYAKKQLLDFMVALEKEKSGIIFN